MDLIDIEKIITISAEDGEIIGNTPDKEGLYPIEYQYDQDVVNEYLSKGWVLLGLDFQSLGIPNGASLRNYILGMPKSNSSK